MSIKVIVSFEVKEFDTFKSGFDTGAHARTEAAVTAEAFKNMDAPNNVWVIGTAASKEAFTAFCTPTPNAIGLHEEPDQRTNE